MDILVQSAFAEPLAPASCDQEPLVVHRRTAERNNHDLLIFVHGQGGRHAALALRRRARRCSFPPAQGPQAKRSASLSSTR